MCRRKPKRSYRGQGPLFLLLALVITAVVVGACVTTHPPQKAQVASEPAVINGVKLRTFGDGTLTLVEILTNKPVPYTAFKLLDPPRIVLDIQATAAETLRSLGPVNDNNVTRIEVKRGKGKGKTRIVVGIAENVDYKVRGEKETISIALNSTEPKTAQPEMAANTGQPNKAEELSQGEAAHSPRIFFKPKKTSLNQVLGVDFTMLDHGNSRLTVTTDKKTPFRLERRGNKLVALTLEQATIPELLQRHLDSSQFEGAVDRVKALFSKDTKEVTLNIALREMVPFHVDQTEQAITIDFGPTQIKPPKKQIIPLALAEKMTHTALCAKREGLPKAMGMRQVTANSVIRKRYTGAPMTMDFVNADVTNILRLIGEVSNLNIVWGPKVKGKVSMRLRNVPWDQALDLVLKNNNLAMRREGNVIWVTTREQMAKIEAREKKRLEDLEKRRREQLKRAKQLKELEPLVTEYITINYVDVANISKIIQDTVKSPRGKITIDKGTKTIIMTDTASKIKEAREVAKRLDCPTKQVMIEARIVEASTSFSRELGIQWNFEMQRRNRSSMSWRGTPEWAAKNTAANYPSGSRLYNPTFSTNHPNFSSNLGLVFTTLSGSGLTGAFINTQIALSESEGELKVLSSPKVVTRDTVKAVIQQGTKIVLPTGTDSNGNKTYKLVDASLKLEVTPHITPNNMVIMDVKISDDYPDYANATGENIPINTKSATTTMMVASGDTVIIGGIYKENKGINETGQPWLKDIPIIGWLFKNKTWTKEKRELLIFLTPTVLPAG